MQTLTSTLKMYVMEVDQKDWDEYAEGLAFALSTVRDRARGDTPILFDSRLGSAIRFGINSTIREYQSSRSGTAAVTISHTTALSTCQSHG